MNKKQIYALAREVKRLALYKWSLIIRDLGYDINIQWEPSLCNLPHQCSFCRVWVWEVQTGPKEEKQRCICCPLLSGIRTCCEEYYNEWNRATNPLEKTLCAKKVYNFIKAITIQEIAARMSQGWPDKVRKYTSNSYFEVTLNSAYEALITKPKE